MTKSKKQIETVFKQKLNKKNLKFETMLQIARNELLNMIAHGSRHDYTPILIKWMTVLNAERAILKKFQC